ncbi:MAG: hypothetical protein R2712_09510 [Vicinamibacterales bacterium]
MATAIRDALYTALGTGGRRRRSRRSPVAASPVEATTPAPASLVSRVDRERSVLDVLEMPPALSKGTFKKQLLRQQGRLFEAQRKAARKGRSVVMVFEGWDAAGKGGTIRRVVAALTPQCYRVVPVAAPTDEERAHHYLWRFWRHLSRAGRVTIFDRSCLSVSSSSRVEGWPPRAWGRALLEIRQFEGGADHARDDRDQMPGSTSRVTSRDAGSTNARSALQELEADRRGLAEPRSGGCASWRSTTWWSTEHQGGAVASRAGQRQEPRPRGGAAHRARRHHARAPEALTRRPRQFSTLLMQCVLPPTRWLKSRMGTGQ